jgi:hypothetical protein
MPTLFERKPMSDRRAQQLAGAAVLLAAAGFGYRCWSKWSGAADPERVGYAPLDTLKPIAPDLWIVDSTIVAGGLAMPIRMTVARLASGGLLLHSPTRLTAELAASIKALGTVEHLVAPSIAHWTHLADWQRAFPDATTWGVPGLRDRPQVRRSATVIDHDLGEAAPAEWQAELTQTLVRGGGGFVEAAFVHRASNTLVLSDLIENLEPAKLPPVTRLTMAAFAGTRGTTALHVRAAVLLGGEEAKRALRGLAGLAPERVIMAHGQMFEEDAERRLLEAFAWAA